MHSALNTNASSPGTLANYAHHIGYRTTTVSYSVGFAHGGIAFHLPAGVMHHLFGAVKYFNRHFGHGHGYGFEPVFYGYGYVPAFFGFFGHGHGHGFGHGHGHGHGHGFGHGHGHWPYGYF